MVRLEPLGVGDVARAGREGADVHAFGCAACFVDGGGEEGSVAGEHGRINAVFDQGGAQVRGFDLVAGVEDGVRGSFLDALHLLLIEALAFCDLDLDSRCAAALRVRGSTPQPATPVFRIVMHHGDSLRRGLRRKGGIYGGLHRIVGVGAEELL